MVDQLERTVDAVRALADTGFKHPLGGTGRSGGDRLATLMFAGLFDPPSAQRDDAQGR